jgi:capsular polysaccharide transport system permease protein
MLQSGEALVNRMNSRSAADAVAEARRTVEEATLRLTAAQSALTNFRNREGVIDPARSAQARGEIIGQLTITLVTLQAERSQIAADTPSSPQLPIIDSRIRAVQQQINSQQAQVTGEANSLAPMISSYEALVMEREFSDRLLAGATAALSSAELDARRQKLYIERIVSPTLPDSPTEPNRWLSILAVLATTLIIYAIGWLILSSVRESKLHE